MKRSRKSNRVTWAPGLNLCQVKLFLTEDCPSKIGSQVQDHLQIKTSWISHHSNCQELNDLPPGFEGSHCMNPLKKESSFISRIEWRCPPKLVMSYNWHVAAGGESQEAEAQKLREMRVLEAVYPRLSAIPPSPSVSLEIEEEYYDDRLTPIIPLTPIEEGAAADISSDLSTLQHTVSNSQPPAFPHNLFPSGTPNATECNTPALQLPANEKLGISPDLGADLITAASAAVMALMKSTECGSLIDTALLVKILSDPKMIEKLINNNQAPTNKTMSSKKQITSLKPQSCPKPSVISSPTPANGDSHLSGLSLPLLGEVQPTVARMSAQQETNPVSGLKRVAPSVPVPGLESTNVSVTRPTALNLYSAPNQIQSSVSKMPAQSITVPKSLVGVEPNPISNLVAPTSGMMPLQSTSAMRTSTVKDLNYIKNLIREHGSEKKETPHSGIYHNNIQNLEFAQNMELREVKPKFQKPCIYFRSPKGCRNGSNCPYQHDMSFQFETGGLMEAPAAKRMKMGGEIIGRT